MNPTNDATEQTLVDHLRSQADEAELTFTLDDVTSGADPKGSSGHSVADANGIRSRLPMLAGVAAAILVVIGGATSLATNTDREVTSAQQDDSDPTNLNPNSEDPNNEEGDNKERDNPNSVALEQVGEERAKQAELVLASMDQYLDDRIDQIIDWTESTEVQIAAAAEYPLVAEIEGIDRVDAIEFRMQRQSEGPVLDVTGASNIFLIDQASEPVVEGAAGTDLSVFTEVIFTDRNGYIVGTTNPTTDFLQADEEWWHTVWDNKIFIEGPGFDQSDEVDGTLDISVRIDDENGEPIGAMKASVDLAGFTPFADELAEQGLEVIVTDGNGIILAHTETGHEVVGTDASMDPIFDEASAAAISAAKEDPNDSGVTIIDEIAIGYAKTASPKRVDRLDQDLAVQSSWIAVVSGDTEATGGVSDAANIPRNIDALIPDSRDLGPDWTPFNTASFTGFSLDDQDIPDCDLGQPTRVTEGTVADAAVPNSSDSALVIVVQSTDTDLQTFFDAVVTAETTCDQDGGTIEWKVPTATPTGALKVARLVQGDRHEVYSVLRSDVVFSISVSEPGFESDELDRLVVQLFEAYDQGQPPANDAGLPAINTAAESLATDADDVDYAEVPAIVGMDLDEAEATVEAIGFPTSIEREFSQDVREGNIISQSPEAGTPVPYDTEVEIVVSQGAPRVAVPDVVGQELPVANSQLDDAGFIDYLAQNEISDSVAPGLVIRTEPPAGESVATNETIIVVISSRP